MVMFTGLGQMNFGTKVNSFELLDHMTGIVAGDFGSVNNRFQDYSQFNWDSMYISDFTVVEYWFSSNRFKT